MRNPSHYYDTGERLDPQQAVDELLVVARWMKKYVHGDIGKIPDDMRTLLQASDEDRLRGFSHRQPTRQYIDEYKQKVQEEFFS